MQLWTAIYYDKTIILECRFSSFILEKQSINKIFNIGCFTNIKHVELALKLFSFPNMGFFMLFRCTKHHKHKHYTKIHSMLPNIHNYMQKFCYYGPNFYTICRHIFLNFKHRFLQQVSNVVSCV